MAASDSLAALPRRARPRRAAGWRAVSASCPETVDSKCSECRASSRARRAESRRRHAWQRHVPSRGSRDRVPPRLPAELAEESQSHSAARALPRAPMRIAVADPLMIPLPLSRSGVAADHRGARRPAAFASPTQRSGWAQAAGGINLYITGVTSRASSVEEISPS